MKYIEQAVTDAAMSYQEYRKLIEHLLGKNKTTGANQSDAMLHYTTMNIVRMERLDRTTRLREETRRIIRENQRPLIWLTLTEAWCGDAAQVIPVLQKMAEENPHIELRLLLRDEHPRLMDAFLTNGGRSIPKLIVLDAHSRKVLGTWGPRPAAAQELVLSGKAEMAEIENEQKRKERFKELVKDLQKWYVKDKTKSTQREVADLIKALKKVEQEV